MRSYARLWKLTLSLGESLAQPCRCMCESFSFVSRVQPYVRRWRRTLIAVSLCSHIALRYACEARFFDVKRWTLMSRPGKARMLDAHLNSAMHRAKSRAPAPAHLVQGSPAGPAKKNAVCCRSHRLVLTLAACKQDCMGQACQLRRPAPESAPDTVFPRHEWS